MAMHMLAARAPHRTNQWFAKWKHITGHNHGKRDTKRKQMKPTIPRLVYTCGNWKRGAADYPIARPLRPTAQARFISHKWPFSGKSGIAAHAIWEGTSIVKTNMEILLLCIGA